MNSIQSRDSYQLEQAEARLAEAKMASVFTDDWNFATAIDAVTDAAIEVGRLRALAEFRNSVIRQVKDAALAAREEAQP